MEICSQIFFFFSYFSFSIVSHYFIIEVELKDNDFFYMLKLA